jgi:hypothetical protein
MNELARISMKISGTIVPNNVKYVYCFAHNNINTPCMIKGLEYNHTSKIICILDNKRAMSGVSSSDEVCAIYNSRDFKTEYIPYDIKHNSINTRTESEALVNWISINNIQQLVICAPPYHTLRAFMTLISVCIERKVNAKIYAVNGMVSDWNDITITHDGNTITSFNSVIELELERIKKYTEKGDICPSDKIWSYIE